MEKVFNGKTCMETQTVFHENGRVSIIPHVTNKNVSLTGDEGRQTVQRGRMITDDDGRSIFHPYMESGIPRYRLMMSTDHGDAKETQTGNLIVTFRLPQTANTKELLLSEAKEMAKKWDVSTKEESSYVMPEIRRETESKTGQRKAKKSGQKKIKEMEEIIEDKSPIISLKKKKNNKNFSTEETAKATSVLRLYNKAIEVYKERYPDGWPCRMSMAKKLTPERISPLCDIADTYSEDEIKTAFWNAVKSAYCNGRTKERSRPADIMWLIEPKVFVRLLEGNV